MRFSTIGPAGWVFADLLLAFGIIFLGVSATLPGRSSPYPSSAPTTPPPTTPPPPVQNVVSINSICRVLPAQLRVAQLSDAALNDEIAKALQDFKSPPRTAERAAAGPQAKLIVTFGYADSVGAGQQLAQRVNSHFHDPELAKRLGNLLSSVATLDTRDYGIASSPQGQVSIELFVAYDRVLPNGAYPQQLGCVGKP